MSRFTRAVVARAAPAAVVAVISMTWAGQARAECTAPPIWGCLLFPGPDAREAGPADGERVTVIGDSLIDELDETLAQQLASLQFHAFTYGYGTTMYYHWNSGLAANGQDIGQLVAANGSKHVVLALGANDVIAMRDRGATGQDVANQIYQGMTRADDTSTGCVILVEPAGHGNASYNEIAQQVRDAIVFLANVRNAQLGSTHFVTLDWHAYSQSHAEWFRGPEDIHHTSAGMQAYRDIISFYLAYARGGYFGC